MKRLTNYKTVVYLLFFLIIYACSNKEEDTGNQVLQILTKEALSIGYENATLGGIIVNSTSIEIIEKGILWGEQADLSFSTDNFTAVGNGNQSFDVILSQLIPNTTYFFQAYIKTQNEILKGETKSFSTKALGMALIETLLPVQITPTTALLKGYVSYEGGSPVTNRGFVIGTLPNPDLSTAEVIAVGQGQGMYEQNVNQLLPGMTYYVRAYAFNALGASYGDVLVFSTPATVPTLTTKPIQNIGLYTAKSGGEIESDGGSVITQKGIVWSTQPNPTISLTTKTLNGGGVSNFEANLNQLVPNTTYYVRAYATNSVGTAYGNTITFNTLPIPTSVTDVDGNVYTVLVLGNQVWMQENLKTTKYCNGDQIPMYMSDVQWQALTTGGWSYYDNIGGNETLGKLYNFYAASDVRNPCPCGWHVPTDAEWTQLENYLIANGMNFDNTTQGNKIAKSMASTNMWQTSSIFGAVGFNPSTNNTSGFNGIPAGRRFNTGEFVNLGSTAAWWTATQQNTTLAWYRWLSKDGLDSKRSSSNKTFGYTIRCVMD
jgi:uncharacterized protein (TIGR02145 family)